jgi:hypothetical protein
LWFADVVKDPWHLLVPANRVNNASARQEVFKDMQHQIRSIDVPYFITKETPRRALPGKTKFWRERTSGTP